MLNLAIPVVIYCVGLIFAAGAGWFALKEVRRQVNGVGAKLTNAIAKGNDRHTRVCIAITSLATQDDEKQNVIQALSGEQL